MSEDKTCPFNTKELKKLGDRKVHCPVKKQKIRVANGKCKSHSCIPLNAN